MAVAAVDLSGRAAFAVDAKVRTRLVGDLQTELVTDFFEGFARGALAHLLVHSLWLSLLTIFFPALGASLHGALAQSESYRLAATSERLAAELDADAAALQAALEQGGPAGAEGVRSAARAALGRILDEHQDWHMLVRPHHLPLA